MFDQANAKLERGPIEIPGVATIDKQTFASGLFEALYQQDLLPEIPRAVRAILEDDKDSVLSLLVRAYSRPAAVDFLKYQATVCSDFDPLYSSAVFQDLVGSVRPVWRSLAASFESLHSSCSQLGLVPGPESSRQPVSFNGLTLIVFPEADSRVTRQSTLRAKDSIPHAQIVEMPLRAHTPALGFQYGGTFDDLCAQSIMGQFIENPHKPIDRVCLSPSTTIWP
ncbi:MAG: hypothetical protein M3Q07_13850 [Pseudobdellovibrionaceae bacterium]|nr:hypothetical protein [Pseudobdellovibrionaceae bacterium]